VVNCYGMTEAANWMAGASSRDGIAEGLVGSMWGGSVAVIDDEDVHRATGEGEIVAQSQALMSGYLNRPDLTAAVIHDGWLRTGDRGSIDPKGRIRLIGRIKDEINRAGLKVQPAELDLLLEQHPAITEACAFALPDPVSGETVAVAVRLVPGGPADIETLRAWCRERLRREAVPERWFIVEQIPRSMRGKVNRDSVRRQLVGEQPRDDAAPR
jgi:acyl-CoA synthetase (AMP-forming)/AMP-acid ligase II